MNTKTQALVACLFLSVCGLLATVAGLLVGIGLQSFWSLVFFGAGSLCGVGAMAIAQKFQLNRIFPVLALVVSGFALVVTIPDFLRFILPK